MNTVNQPNFFILGAAKCGTTSLHHYLSQHPEIFLTAEKETCFFCREFQVIDNPEDYYGLFDGVTNEWIIGESSHVYMTSPDTPAMLHDGFPEARFLVTLRHPADRAHSLYHHMRRNGLESIPTFEQALAAEEERFQSDRFRETCPQYLYNFLYFRSGLFGEQLARYFALFRRDQFKIITLRELKQDPVTTLQDIFRFLNVDATFQPDLSIQNEGMAARSPLIQRLLNNRGLADTVKNWNWLRRLALGPLRNMLFRDVPPMDPSTREALAIRYRSDLALLDELVGRQLSL